MPGLNYARMYRTHGHFVDLFPFHGVVIVISRNIFMVVVTENIRHIPAVGVIANHFQPWMAFWPYAELFSHLPLKHVKGFTLITQ